MQDVYFNLEICPYILSVIVYFCFFLFLISLIPSSSLNNSIASTITTFQKEGTYPTVGIPWRKIVLDNYTDPLMFNTAYALDSQEPIRSVLLNKRYEDPADHLNQISNLKKLYEEDVNANVGYERYWHGYLVYLRPLLVIFNYDTIRIINFVALYGGFLWLMFLSWKQLGKKVTTAFLIGFIAVDFFFIWKSLQFSGVFLIAIYASIYLLQTAKKTHNPFFIFFIVGGITSFIDLLTAPLITLGMMLIVYRSLYKSNLKDVVFYCIFWALGYLSLWFTKWLLVEVFISAGAIQNSFNQIVNRTVSEPDPNFTHINTLKLNIFQLIGYDKSNKIFVLGAAIVTAVFVLRYVSFDKKRLEQMLVWSFLGIIPYAWYLVAANHSYLHVWYTYRTQFITVVCVFLLLAEFVDWKRVRKAVGK